MRYWPLSLMATDPRMHHSVTWELMCVYVTPVLSQGTMDACASLAAMTATEDVRMVIVHTLDASTKRCYLAPPSADHFMRLERAGFVQGSDFFGFSIDSLH